QPAKFRESCAFFLSRCPDPQRRSPHSATVLKESGSRSIDYRSVLNPRSPELWRKTAEETKFWVSDGVARCGGLLAQARTNGHFLRARKQAENLVSCAGAEREGLLSFSFASRLPYKLPYARENAAKQTDQSQ